jgi:addiction module HigA family antidote
MSIQTNEYAPQSISHPGLSLAEKLEEMGMGVKEFSVRVNKPEKTIIAVTKGKSSITPDMAVKFEDVLNIPAGFWLKRQHRYDEYMARVKKEESILQAIDWVKKFPYAKMASLGWVPATRKVNEKAANLFNFFKVSDHQAWESYYYNQELKVSFRISLAHTNEAMAVAAWLRQGELQAEKLSVPDYDAGKLKKSLSQIKSIMASHPEDFFQELCEVCKDAGVKVVYTPCLPKAPIHGCTRWIGDTPLIQLSARYNANDKFWFTLFHEIGHILLHGKKYISIENINYSDQDIEKEEEADRFAVEHTFSEREEEEVLNSIPLNPDKLRFFAKKFNTHPAMIIGRFHHKRLVPYSIGREFIEPVNLHNNS